MMEYLFSFAIIWATAAALTVFLDAFLVRADNRMPMWLRVLLYALVSTISLNLIPRIMWLQFAVTVTLTFCYSLFAYKSTVLKSIFLAVVYQALVSLISSVVSYLYITITGVQVQDLRSGYLTFLIGAGMSLLVLFLLVFVIKKALVTKRGGVALSWKEWISVLIFPVVSSTVLAAIFQESAVYGYVTILQSVSVVGLLVANVAQLFLAEKLESERTIRENANLLQQQLKLEKTNLQTLLEYEESQARQLHDHKNHMYTLAALLESRNTTEAKNYLAGLNGSQLTYQSIIHTRNPIADAVLNLKYSTAKKMGIPIIWDLDNLAEFPLKGEMFAAVLSNVLDNAIEASAMVSENPEIRVKLRCSQHESIFSVRNRTAQPVLVEDNHVRGTRADHQGSHGYGLKNVEMILQEHKFDFVYHYEDGWFQFTAMHDKQG